MKPIGKTNEEMNAFTAKTEKVLYLVSSLSSEAVFQKITSIISTGLDLKDADDTYTQVSCECFGDEEAV